MHFPCLHIYINYKVNIYSLLRIGKGKTNWNNLGLLLNLEKIKEKRLISGHGECSVLGLKARVRWNALAEVMLFLWGAFFHKRKWSSSLRCGRWESKYKAAQVQAPRPSAKGSEGPARPLTDKANCQGGKGIRVLALSLRGIWEQSQRQAQHYCCLGYHALLIASLPEGASAQKAGSLPCVRVYLSSFSLIVSQHVCFSAKMCFGS